MADSPGKEVVVSFSVVKSDDLSAAAKGTRAVAENRILETKRTYPVLPTERTLVFTG
jgi:hypothetical protein